MESTLKFLLSISDSALNGRGSLLSLWQTIADHFYPERADFTAVRTLGEEFGSELMSSYPVLVRRDLGDSLSSMLRPTNKAWFHQRTKDNWDKVGPEGRAWLENADSVMRRAMNNQASGFSRATKEADHDFATFGQAVLQVSMNSQQSGLLYRTWHLRDCAWLENEDGAIDSFFRKWEPTARVLVRMFGSKAHPKVHEASEKDPNKTFLVRHCVVPSDMLHGEKIKQKFVSVYIDVNNQHIIEKVGIHSTPYLVPRWRTVSGSQYAVSPATCVALPDARLLQSMIWTLLEAGEKAVNPPMAASKEVFRGDFALFAGGVTWADVADGRLSDHFSTIGLDKNGLPFGMESADRIQNMLAQAFYINKLQLPSAGVKMTAYEFGQRVQEYIRQAMPLFEPMEYEYNAPLCDKTFDVLFRVGAFGSALDIPKEIQGLTTTFSFESPLHDAIERARSQQFMETNALVQQAVAIDPTALHVVDIKKAFRDALLGSGIPAKWVRSEEESAKLAEQEQQASQNAEMLAQMQQGADIAQTTAETQATMAGQV